MYFHVKRTTKQTIMGTLLLRAAVEARSALLWFRWPHSQFSINKKRCCHCSTALWAVLLTNSPSITLRLMLFVRRRNSQGPFNGISGNLLWWKLSTAWAAVFAEHCLWRDTFIWFISKYIHYLFFIMFHKFISIYLPSDICHQDIK